MEVFKIQRSVFPTGKILMYNKDRSYYGEISVTKGLLELLKDDSKVYVLGEVTETGIINIQGVTDTPHPYW